MTTRAWLARHHVFLAPSVVPIDWRAPLPCSSMRQRRILELSSSLDHAAFPLRDWFRR